MGMIEYDSHVKAVGELVMLGVWYSDACEIVAASARLQKRTDDEWWDRFETDVNNYTSKQIQAGRVLPIPKYECIF